MWPPFRAPSPTCATAAAAGGSWATRWPWARRPRRRTAWPRPGRCGPAHARRRRPPRGRGLRGARGKCSYHFLIDVLNIIHNSELMIKLKLKVINGWLIKQRIISNVKSPPPIGARRWLRAGAPWPCSPGPLENPPEQIHSRAAQPTGEEPG